MMGAKRSPTSRSICGSIASFDITCDRSFAIADTPSTMASTIRAASATDASFTTLPAGASSALESAVSAAVEDQRLALVLVAELHHPADDDHVVAGVVLGDRLAVDERQRVVENR